MKRAVAFDRWHIVGGEHPIPVFRLLPSDIPCPDEQRGARITDPDRAPALSRRA
jgi:hypothetical protein